MIAPLRSAAAAALLLLLCIAALCPAALAGGNPSSTAKCPVTINYSESDIPAECMSKEADDVCKKCLGDIVKKSASWRMIQAARLDRRRRRRRTV